MATDGAPTTPADVIEDGNRTEDLGLFDDPKDEEIEKAEVEEKVGPMKQGETEEEKDEVDDKGGEEEEEVEKEMDDGGDEKEKDMEEEGEKVAVQTPPKNDAKKAPEKEASEKKAPQNKEAQKQKADDTAEDPSETKKRQRLAVQLIQILKPQLQAAVAKGNDTDAAIIKAQIDNASRSLPPDASTTQEQEAVLCLPTPQRQLQEAVTPSLKRKHSEMKDYTAVARLQQQPDEPPLDEVCRRLEDQLQQALKDEDYKTADKVKQELHSVKALAPSPANDPTRKRKDLEEQIKAAVSKKNFSAAARLQQQLDELALVTTTAKDSDEVRRHLEEQLQKAVKGADFITADKVKQELDKLLAASTTVNDHARERQRLEELLKVALAKEDYATAASIQKQINDGAVAASTGSTRKNLHQKLLGCVPPELNG